MIVISTIVCDTLNISFRVDTNTNNMAENKNKYKTQMYSFCDSNKLVFSYYLNENVYYHIIVSTIFIFNEVT